MPSRSPEEADGWGAFTWTRLWPQAERNTNMQIRNSNRRMEPVITYRHDGHNFWLIDAHPGPMGCDLLSRRPSVLVNHPRPDRALEGDRHAILFGRGCGLDDNIRTAAGFAT